MPCLRHKQDISAALCVIKEYTPVEMYMHVLGAIPLKLNTVYRAGNQDSFRTDVYGLILRLEAASLNIKQTKGM